MRVLRMKPTEEVRLDHGRLCALYAQLGDHGAEDIVCRAMEEMGLRLSRCADLFDAEKWDDLRSNVRSLVAVGDQVGMGALTGVALDVLSCIEAGERVALAATLSRLVRVGERSLTLVWESPKIPV